MSLKAIEDDSGGERVRAEDRVKIGIIGTGVGVRTLLPGFRRHASLEVQTISGSSSDRAEEIAREHGIPSSSASFEEVCDFPGLDLLCVASPNEFHVQHALRALKTSRHVYLEKPTGSSLEEARLVADAARAAAASGAMVLVGHQLRFNPYIRWIQRVISSEEFGRPYHIEVCQRAGTFNDPELEWTWHFDSERGGGVRLAMGTHMLDLTNFLLGATPLALHAHLDPVHPVRRPNGNNPRPVAASSYCSLAADYGACAAFMSMSAASHAPDRFTIDIDLSRASIHFDGAEAPTVFHRGQRLDCKTDVDDDDYRDRPGSSLFRKSFTYMADEIEAAFARRSFSIPIAASPEESAVLIGSLDKALEDYLTRGPQVRDGF